MTTSTIEVEYVTTSLNTKKVCLGNKGYGKYGFCT